MGQKIFWKKKERDKVAQVPYVSGILKLYAIRGEQTHLSSQATFILQNLFIIISHKSVTKLSKSTKKCYNVKKTAKCFNKSKKKLINIKNKKFLRTNETSEADIRFSTKKNYKKLYQT